MKAGSILLRIVTHCAAAGIGFALGIYALPILTAPPAPTISEIESVSAEAMYTTEFTKDLKDSDALHWGEGTVSVSSKNITLMGKLAPGPDYKLYLSPEFVETESDFKRLKKNMLQVGSIKTFENFIIPVASDINLENYNTVIVWCEAFGQFISSAKYK